jgi:hypothetical protein
MEAFVVAHAGLSFSSLPRFVEGGGTEVVLGIAGPPAEARVGLVDLQAGLDKGGIAWRLQA